MSISKTTFLLAAVASTCLTAAGRAEDLAATVAGSLRDSGALSGYRVNVKSKSGTVWLEGRVADEKRRRPAWSGSSTDSRSTTPAQWQPHRASSPCLPRRSA